MWNRILRRFQYWRNHEERETHLREEMQFHIEELTADLINQGVDAKIARAQALQQFGNITQQAEAAQETWIYSWLSDASQDLKYAIRGLLRQPAFALFAITILSLGIGASTTVYSVLNTLILKNLPVQNPSRLVWITNSGETGLSGETIQVDHLKDTESNSKSFDSLGAYMAFYGIGETLSGTAGNYERITNVGVSCNFLPTLGIQPAQGRQFTHEECKWNAPGAIMLSHGYWVRRFAGKEGVIGTRLLYNGKPATVVGILPASFDFGAMFAPGVRVDSLSAFPLSPETNRWGNTLSVVGRLRPGVSIAAAQSELLALARNFEKVPNRNDFKPIVSSLVQKVGGSSRTAVWIITASVLVVMCIVCANLASLQLARAAARQKEFAIRTSLGAGRLRLIRQLLVESLLLSAAGCSLGVGLAAAGIQAIARLDTIRVPMLSQVRLEPGVILFAVLLAAISGLVFGLLPALQIGVTRVHDALKDSARGASAGTAQAWTRNGLVIGEVAFACVLLVCAGLLIRSMVGLLDIDLGFAPERAVTMAVDARNDIATTNELLRKVREIPGVEFAGITDSMPFGKNRSWAIADASKARRRENFNDAFVRVISDGFIPAMGMRMIEGRDFNDRDLPETDPVVIINRAAAKLLWPGESAIGRLIYAGGTKPARVVGVVDNLRHIAVEESSGLEFYLSTRQMRDRNGAQIVVRSSTPSPQLGTLLKQALLPIDPSANRSEVIEVQALVDRSISPRRLLLVCLSGFSLFALLLASLGIYALISYTVEQRRKELGIRLALGASSSTLKSGMLLHTLIRVSAGILIGVLGAIPVAKAIEGLLYGIQPIDLPSFLLAAITFTAVALVAGYVPVRRISNIDPLEALRQDG